MPSTRCRTRRPHADGRRPVRLNAPGQERPPRPRVRAGATEGRQTGGRSCPGVFRSDSADGGKHRPPLGFFAFYRWELEAGGGHMSPGHVTPSVTPLVVLDELMIARPETWTRARWRPTLRAFSSRAQAGSRSPQAPARGAAPGQGRARRDHRLVVPTTVEFSRASQATTAEAPARGMPVLQAAQGRTSAKADPVEGTQGPAAPSAC
jgi:hypothetical protein